MLKLINARKTFNPKTANEQVALDGLNLSLEAGGFLTVVGGNGSGKSTLLNIVAGVFPLDCGHILLDGEDITQLPEHKRAAHIGRVFQDPLMGTAADMTIEENMALAARRGQKRGLRRGLAATEREHFRSQLAVLELGLEDRLTTRMGLLSGGQRQAVTLLMAALRRPKLLLLDEHTSALDPKTAAKVMEISDTIVRSHRLTTLMVTHNMRDAIRYGDRLLMMQDGQATFEAKGDAKQNLAVGDMLERFAV